MAPEKVKAAVMFEDGRIEIKEFPYPRLNEDTAILKMEMAGICGTDKHMYHGDAKIPGKYKGSPFPNIPGHEDVGVINEIGEKAARVLEVGGKILKEGDRVVPACDILCKQCWACNHIFGYPACEHMITYGVSYPCDKPPYLNGGFAEYMYIIPKTFLFKVPDGVPPDLAVLTEPLAVSYGSYMKAASVYPMAKEGFGPGDTVVVQGPGPLGACHALMGMMMGASKIIVIGSGTSEDEFRLKIMKDLGIHITVNEPVSEDRVKAVRDHTEGRGADMVIECAGVPKAFTEGLEMVREGGTLIEAGNFVDLGPTPMSPYRICSRTMRIIGISGMPYQGYEAALRLLDTFKDKIAFAKLITHRFRIDDAQEALETTFKKAMKVVVTP